MLPGKTLEFQGLTEFQEDLLEVAQKEMPNEMQKVMRKVGNRGATWARREARAKLKSQPTGNYMKGIKSGRPFIDNEGKIVVRILNTAPHAHLIEYGHEVKRSKGGPVLGYAHGKYIIENAAKHLDRSGDFETHLSRGFDEMLKKKGL